MKSLIIAAASVAALAGLFGPTEAQAQCVGNCGTLGADGVVTLAPGDTDGLYRWVSTNGGVTGAGQISGVGGTNGSLFTSAAFAAAAGDQLKFAFNYVTTDGSGYADYAFAVLKNIDTAALTYLFTARTQPSGTIAPGFGLPALNATLTPNSVPITPGAPAWSPLGEPLGTCFDAGCGYTGWVQSDYTIATAGNYQISFGVTNWDDNAFQSGLAFDGVTIAGTPVIPGVPEPSTWAMMLIGFAGLSLASGRRRTVVMRV
jgi:hypothetical protein